MMLSGLAAKICPVSEQCSYHLRFTDRESEAHDWRQPSAMNLRAPRPLEYLNALLGWSLTQLLPQFKETGSQAC